MPKKHAPRKPAGRRLGQHFLFDKAIRSRMADVASVSVEDNVLEIGPGPGALTETLAERAGAVAAVELDGALIPKLAERLARFTNVSVIHADILKVDLEAIWRERFGGKPFKVVANLPYYITTPVIMRLLECSLPVAGITLMVQKEVADRLTSPPGSRDYGAISVAVQYRTEAVRAFLVPPGAFSPPPNVQSAVLHMAVRKKPPVAVADEALFERTVRGCFTSRRKTLRNNMSAAFGIGGSEAAMLLESAGLDPGGRAEQLSLDDFAALANRLTETGYRADQHRGE